MSNLHKIFNWLITILLVSIISVSHSQTINVSAGRNITNIQGDELNAQWSNDGKSILFQSVNNNKSSLCIYQIDFDTLICYDNPEYNFNNPVWHPDGGKIVFDSEKNGADYLYVLDLKTNTVKSLFSRNISCRNASFSASSRQVYFTGYNELNKRWEIYSYDFIYDNLNKLTNYKLGCSNPSISNNGKLIAYCKLNPFNNTKSIEVINWYGEPVISFKDFSASSPIWNTTGFKLYFISEKDNKSGELYSIWKNGTHLERLTNDTLKIQDISISPDETNIAISVFTKNGWDIFIIPFDE